MQMREKERKGSQLTRGVALRDAFGEQRGVATTLLLSGRARARQRVDRNELGCTSSGSGSGCASAQQQKQ